MWSQQVSNKCRLFSLSLVEVWDMPVEMLLFCYLVFGYFLIGNHTISHILNILEPKQKAFPYMLQRTWTWWTWDEVAPKNERWLKTNQIHITIWTNFINESIKLSEICIYLIFYKFFYFSTKLLNPIASEEKLSLCNCQSTNRWNIYNCSLITGIIRLWV